jgi:bifunctional DNase/RNase
MTTADAVRWTDVSVAEIRGTDDENTGRRKYVMTLQELGSERRVPMWIGPAEATALALALALESAETPRPLTYQLAASLVAAAGARVTEVRITLQAPVFHAAVLVQSPAGLQEVDSRPSDAVNLALAAGAPIRLDRDLFGLDHHLEEVSSYPVVTADLAAEAQQRMAWQKAVQGCSGLASWSANTTRPVQG